MGLSAREARLTDRRVECRKRRRGSLNPSLGT